MEIGDKQIKNKLLPSYVNATSFHPPSKAKEDGNRKL